jgi:uncharacterized protein YbjQ (UPF0145 family)
MKPYKLLYLSGILLLLSSCSLYAPTYFGAKYPATDTVESFYAAKDVKRPYKVIGHMNVPITPLESQQERAKRNLVAQGKKIGADAIIISELSRQTTKSGDALSIKAEAILYTDK